MNHSEPKRSTPFSRFVTFNAHFFHYCYVLRSVLGMQLALVVLLGFLFSRFEDFSAWEGIYFALITSTTVGFGDITPSSVIGQCISIVLALIGTIFFGLVVSVATRAFSVTIHQYMEAEGKSETRIPGDK